MKIRNIRDLCREVGEPRDRIGRRLYKATECGITYGEVPRCESLRNKPYKRRCKGIVLSGYCEGTDRECPWIELRFPFSSKRFWAAVDEADRDGIDLWNATHGCESCGGAEDEFGDRAVNPTCGACDGHGEIV